MAHCHPSQAKAQHPKTKKKWTEGREQLQGEGLPSIKGEGRHGDNQKRSSRKGRVVGTTVARAVYPPGAAKKNKNKDSSIALKKSRNNAPELLLVLV